jgi:hypothetical protein
LDEIGTRVAKHGKLFFGLDAFHDDARFQIAAQGDHAADQLALTCVPVNASDQFSVELYDVRFEIGDAL